MSATYSNTLATDRDWIRWRLTDVGPDFIRDNEEIDALLVMYTDKRRVAAELAQSIGVEFARKITSFTDEDGMSVSWQKRSDAFFLIAKTLYAELAAEEIDTAADAFGSVRARRAHDCLVGEYSSRPVWGYRREW